MTNGYFVLLRNVFAGTLSRTENDISGTNKKPKRGLLRSLLCCLGRSRSKGPVQGLPSGDGRGSPPLSTGSPHYLLPSVRHQDMHKKCMVIDLDETLVHSSFKVSVPPRNAVKYIILYLIRVLL